MQFLKTRAIKLLTKDQMWIPGNAKNLRYWLLQVCRELLKWMSRISEK